MIISMRRRFAFIHLYKTAGESIECGYDAIARWDDLILGGPTFADRIQQPYRQRFGLHKHSTALEVREIIGAETWSQLYSFAFVRDPAERAASLYAYARRLSSPTSLRRRMLVSLGLRKPPNQTAWATVRACRETSSFSEWLRHPLVATAEGMRPQTEFLLDTDGTQLVTDVFRFEELQLGWKRVCQRLDLGDVPLPHRNASRTGARSPIDDADRRWIRERMAPDYAAFDYD